MGWSSGTRIVEELIWTVEENVKDSNVRKNLYADIIDAFQSADWDNIDEVLGLSDDFDEIANGVIRNEDIV